MNDKGLNETRHSKAMDAQTERLCAMITSMTKELEACARDEDDAQSVIDELRKEVRVLERHLRQADDYIKSLWVNGELPQPMSGELRARLAPPPPWVPKLVLDVTVNEYRVQQDDRGRLTAMRNGLLWRECSGDGLICGLAHEIERLRATEPAKE